MSKQASKPTFEFDVFWVWALQGQIFLLKMLITKLPTGGKRLLHVVSSSAPLVNLETSFHTDSWTLSWWSINGKFTMMRTPVLQKEGKHIVFPFTHITRALLWTALWCCATLRSQLHRDTRLTHKPATEAQHKTVNSLRPCAVTSLKLNTLNQGSALSATMLLSLERKFSNLRGSDDNGTVYVRGTEILHDR